MSWNYSKARNAAAHLRLDRESAYRFERRHTLTTLAVVGSLIILVSVPQVRNVVFEMPGRVPLEDIHYVFLWNLHIVVLWLVGMTLAKFIVPPLTDKDDNHPVPTLEDQVTAQPSEHHPWWKAWIGPVLLIIVGCLYLSALALFHQDPSQSLGLARWLPLPAPFILIALGAWAAPLHERILKPEWMKWLRSPRRPVRQIAIRLGVAVAIMYGLAELLWRASEIISFVSYRPYTVWVIFLIFFVIVFIARALDALYRLGFKFVRLTAVAVVLIIPFSWRPATVGRMNAVIPSATSVTKQWFQAFKTKLEAMPDGPVIFVAASGGGARAALYTGLVLDSLDRRQPDGTRLADRVLLISSVSGGSLACAYFATHSPQEDRDYKWKHSITSDLAERVQCELERLDAVLSTSDESLRPIKDVIPSEITTSRFIDHMNMDFMAPVLRGFVLTSGRGQRLSRFWEEHFDWSGHSNLDGIRVSPGGRIPPVLLLNSTSVADGKRLVVGIPAVPPLLFDREECDVSSVSSERLGFRLSLAEAVRLSSNFPWGIPVARLRMQGANCCPLNSSQLPPTVGKRIIDVVDGGVYDNTGLDMIYEVIASLKHFAELDDSDDPCFAELASCAKVLREQLQNRGVIIIEIDSGAKPADPGVLARLLPILFEPLHALKQSAHARTVEAKNDHLLHSFELMAEVGGTLGVDDKEDEPIRYFCGDVDVMTAWALGPNGKAAVITRFLIESPDNTKLLAMLTSQPAIARGPDESEAEDGAARDKVKVLAKYREVSKALQEQRVARMWVHEPTKSGVANCDKVSFVVFKPFAANKGPQDYDDADEIRQKCLATRQSGVSRWNIWYKRRAITCFCDNS